MQTALKFTHSHKIVHAVMYSTHKHPFTSETFIAGQYLGVCVCMCFLCHAAVAAAKNHSGKSNELGQLIHVTLLFLPPTLWHRVVAKRRRKFARSQCHR